ncbi:MAG TPA: GNAT family N-acetyltransferase [Rectinemataceae bacterium]|nr:GNAT family N-acetyltransferase [Rectinemataceae bacterium]
MDDERVMLPGAPNLPGLVTRHFRGQADFEGMAAAISAAADADGVERVGSADDLAATYNHLHNCDLFRDFLIVELSDTIIGYARVQWDEEVSTGAILGLLIAFLAPEGRGHGLGRALLRWQEERLRELLGNSPGEAGRYYQVFCAEEELSRVRLLEHAGYRPIRFFHEMVRPSLEGIPDFPLPEGLETRPVLPADYRPIWEAWQAALVDHWGYTRPSDEEYKGWLEDQRIFQPELWQVAWERSTDRVAGGVLGFIDRIENEKYRRTRGYTECIHVGREWRRRGVARALIASSLRAQKALGMTESALGVDSESLTGATRVYADCGFAVRKTMRLYRKAF